jgi:predicted ATPase
MIEKKKLIFRRSLKRENYEFGNQEVFFDRGIIDCFVYSEFYLGKIPDEIKSFDCLRLEMLL